MDLAESSHSCDDSSGNYSDLIEEEGVGANDAADAVKDGPPFASIEFNDGRGEEAGEEDEKVVAANIAVNVVIPSEGAEGAAEVRPCPLSLPAFGSGRVSNAAAGAVWSSGSRGGTSRNLQPAPRRSLSSMSSNSGGGSRGKTKNSTNYKQGSISKAMDRMVQSLESGGGVLMLSMQMQQTAHQLSMQQQMFQQQMQMQMSAMEKRVETSKKYFYRIAKSMTSHYNKRKRGRTDEEDDDSSNDDK